MTRARSAQDIVLGASPGAAVEHQKTWDGKTYYLVRARSGRLLGEGDTPAAAWRNARRAVGVK